MYEYVHGGDQYTAKIMAGREEILDFSVNTNPLGLPAEVKQALCNALKTCEQYPDPFCRELTAALAEYEQTDPQNILCGNGASELIFRLVIALKPQSALLCAPTFADYEKALRMVDCDITFYPLSEDNEFKIDTNFIEKITPETDMVYFCNPNNPTGQLSSKDFLQGVLERCHQMKTILVVDECFMDFVEEPQDHSLQQFIHHYDNLVILKAFTKTFAMAGIRLGYVLTSNPVLIEKLRHSGQDWSVSGLAQAAGITALKQTAYLQATKRMIPEERNYLIHELTKMNCKVFGSKANYIFFKTNIVRDLKQALLTKGIMIRSCANYRHLNQRFYRVAIKTRRENIKLIQHLKEVIQGENHDGHS